MSDHVTPCFVIMPFSKTTEEHTENYWTEHFEHFLKPIIEESKKFKAFRSEPLREDILRQIIKELISCPIVLADITDRNANVFWELGIRQSFKQGTITIAEKGTKIPFDISVKGILKYNTKDHLKYDKFKKQLQKALNDCVKNPHRPDSVVLETISGRGSLYEIIHRDEVIRRLKALLRENANNRVMFAVVYSTIKENRKKKDPEDYDYLTSRFRFSALSLLITNRYLDAKESLYDLAESLLECCITWNTNLNEWANENTATEAWFLKKSRKKEMKDALKKFEEEIGAVIERLETMY